MSKILVSYFSASGITKKVAEKIADVVDGTLFEIDPKEKYKNDDLDWTNKQSRSSIEMRENIKPEIRLCLSRIANITGSSSISPLFVLKNIYVIQ